jgi:hypothetical protein
MKLASQMPVLDFLDAAFLAGQHDRGVDPLALQAEPAQEWRAGGEPARVCGADAALL